MHYTYLLIDLGSLIIPLLFSAHPLLNFHKTWKAFFPAVALSGIGFISWDMLYTHLGVWGFNKDYLTGIMFFNLPVEEILFFFCIPYACVFTYHCISLAIRLPSRSGLEKWLTPLFIFILLLVAGMNFPKLYTTASLTILAFLLVLSHYMLRVSWLLQFYFIYTILLGPFILVNGLLTGSWIDAPIVWYNNEENLGIRILTIPIEDIFYGMAMILSVLLPYEYWKKRNSPIDS